MANKILQNLIDKKIINQVSELPKIEKCLQEKKAIYVGFDPSFCSLHLGNYIMINLLNYFDRQQIPTIAVIGGMTGLIGDPSGKKSERQMQPAEVIHHNVECLTKQLKQLTKAKIINNYDFYREMSLVDFFRQIGKLINVNYLLEKDIIKNRLESGISYTEFSYNLLQGHDFLHLVETQNVGIQCGGSDQWGNITTGLEMIRKCMGPDTQVGGLTINLLTKQDGTKFGKSENGALYLDAKITNPREVYQFLINQADEDLEKLFCFWTLLTIDEIKEILQKHECNKKNKYGQKLLAKMLMDKLYGPNVFEEIDQISQVLFLDKWNELSQTQMTTYFHSQKVIELEQPIKLVDLMIQHKIIASKRVFRELLRDSALMVNNKVVDNEEFTLSKENGFFKTYFVIKKGKKNYYFIRYK